MCGKEQAAEECAGCFIYIWQKGSKLLITLPMTLIE